MRFLNTGSDKCLLAVLAFISLNLCNMETFSFWENVSGEQMWILGCWRNIILYPYVFYKNSSFGEKDDKSKVKHVCYIFTSKIARDYGWPVRKAILRETLSPDVSFYKHLRKYSLS